MTTTLALNTNELQNIGTQPTSQAMPRAAALLADLVQDRSFLNSHVLRVLEVAHDAGRWYVARRWDAPDGYFSLQVFVWPPGTRTMIHDHSSWGAYACAAGTVLEERYERLDDGSRHEHARLREVWQLPWSPRDGASTVQPGTGASTGSVIRTRRPLSRCISMGLGWATWTAGTTTPRGITSATGWKTRRKRSMESSPRNGRFRPPRENRYTIDDATYARQCSGEQDCGVRRIAAAGG